MIFNQQVWDNCAGLAMALRFLAQKTKCAACATAHLNALKRVSEGKTLTLEEQEGLMCPRCAAVLEAESRRIAEALSRRVSRSIGPRSSEPAPCAQSSREEHQRGAK